MISKATIASVRIWTQRNQLNIEKKANQHNNEVQIRNDTPLLFWELSILNEYDKFSAITGPQIGRKPIIKLKLVYPTCYYHSMALKLKSIQVFGWVLDVCGIMKICDIDDNVLRLYLFPLSLKERTKHWFKLFSTTMHLTTWDKL